MVLYYCDHWELPLPPGHRFPVTKYKLLRERLAATGLFDLQPAPLASRADLVRVHESAYIDAFLTGTLSPQVIRRIGFPWSPGLVQRTLASAGSTLASSRRALAHGWGGGLAGGTHHAFRNEGSGFCVVNDIAIAIEALRQDGAIRRAAVVDLDVHQGDGTAAIFEADPDVLTISLHGKNNFPFRKQQSKIDVEFADETGDEEYLSELARILPEVGRFSPDLVFFQSGVDALATDRLGKLMLTPDGMRRRDEMVLSLPFPLVVTLGGGYSDPIEATVEAHFSTFISSSALRAASPVSARSGGGPAPNTTFPREP